MAKDYVFKVGDIPIKSNLILAPMDGLTDHPFREIIKRFHPGIIFSEFINAYDYLNDHPFFPQQIVFSEEQRPFAYQIFDNSPDRILKTALYLSEKNPDFIDINMGCSAKTVASRGAGAGLLKEPEKIKQILTVLTNNLTIPISAKIRLGWDDTTLNYLSISKLLEDYGCAMISVHGRTKKQGYQGKANWDAIAEIKQNVKIPVLANGDVNSLSDIQKIIKVTNCDGVMIGRAALRNPWIFSGLDSDQVTLNQRFDLLSDHLDLMIQFYGLESGLILFRKYIKFYLDISNLGKEFRSKLYNHNDPRKLKSSLFTIMNAQIN
ncbi:MAG: tRNA dihydrouridine synthase DusB [Chloroflexi bacterium HGW-Chloroflexi-2]|jgi:nifR3 family TIM-barrel protein|nr:MAG: tRNA dihydrouridine synthase DusB [Chloroflexi bacterium HGW-Chloroflexi-2]